MNNNGDGSLNGGSIDGSNEGLKEVQKRVYRKTVSVEGKGGIHFIVGERTPDKGIDKRRIGIVVDYMTERKRKGRDEILHLRYTRPRNKISDDIEFVDVDTNITLIYNVIYKRLTDLFICLFTHF